MNPPIKDYAVSVRIRNNYLLKAMEEAGISSGAELARRAGVSQSSVANCIRLAQVPLVARQGRSLKERPLHLSKTVVKIANALGKHPLDLFPPQHHEKPLRTGRIDLEMDLQQMLLLSDPPKTPEDLCIEREYQEIVPHLLEALPGKYRKVIEDRYGFNGSQKTFVQIGQELGVSHQYARQLEGTALRRLRKICRNKTISQGLGRDD